MAFVAAARLKDRLSGRLLEIGRTPESALRVIKSRGERATQALFDGRPPGKLRSIAKVATRKLDMLGAAARLQDLRQPPGNRFRSPQSVIAPASTRSGSMISGGSASCGWMAPRRDGGAVAEAQ